MPLWNAPQATVAEVEAAQATADQALADASLVWSEVVFTISNLGITTPPTLNVIAPVTGTLETVAIGSTGVPNANLVAATSIGGVTVTNGTATQVSGDAAGTVRMATATAANAVTALVTSVLITFTATGNTVGMRSTVVLGFRRS